MNGRYLVKVIPFVDAVFLTKLSGKSQKHYESED
jgi:hypothetical protein